jgi:multidrug efflux pump subunit AcrA (membrane-fusion protein)
MDGVLTHLNLRPGREVQGYKTIGTVADVTQLEVSAMTAGIDLDKIAIGMEAFIERSSGLGNTALGSVRRLPIAAALGEEGDDSVRITLADSPLELGYTLGDIVKITVTLEKKENALWLPPQAIRTFESRRFVVVQEGSAQQRVDVKLGIIGEDRVEILEGLTEGQVVVSP